MGRIEREDTSISVTRKVIVRPEAEREIQEAFDWYEEKSEGLGFEFLRAADACLSGIRRNPSAFQIVHSKAHRALLRKFLYALFYVISDETIIIIACFHIKRSPVDWLHRA